MKIYNIFFLYCIAGISTMVAGQSDNEELVKWNASKKLTWADYKSKPDPTSDAAASTTTYLKVEYNISSTKFDFKIESFFSKTRSWGLHKTAYILSHEQGHFDIAEVYARKLYKALSEYKFNKRTYQKDLEKIYKKVTDEKGETQNDYDKETKHSINKTRQAEWLVKIAEMLEEYEDWSGY
jgi:predicted secreted Zn-dependent protease